MDVESSTTPFKPNGGEAIKPPRSRRRRIICISVIIGILSLVLLFVILGLTVFKAKSPTITVNTVSLADLHVSLDLPKLKVNLNVSLDVNLSIKNPNIVGLKYSNSTALLYYNGQTVGDVPIPAGKISSDETKAINITLTVLADRLLGNSDLYSDVISGTIDFTVFTKISGKVSILKLFKIHVVSKTTCDVTVDVSNRTVSNSRCNYDTKL